VPAGLRAKITAERAALKQPGASVFTGPLRRELDTSDI
jgi:hypothetical protein